MVHSHWLAEHQVDQLHALLKARGFTGTRTDETRQASHLVTFEQGKARLVMHAARNASKPLWWLTMMADDVLRDASLGHPIPS
jgi:hypothetical protein